MKYTRTTAKRGMVEYKVGDGRDKFDYGFIEELDYNDKLTVKALIQALDQNTEKAHEYIAHLEKRLKQAEAKNDALERSVRLLADEIKDTKTKTLEAIRGLITR